MSTSIKYSGRVDPIQLLRTSIINGKKIKQKGKYLDFDKDIKLLIKSPTAWLSPITNKQYSLGAIWLYLECKDKSTEYLTKATELEVEMINIADKEEIQKYFTGKIADSKCINQELKLQLLTKSVAGKRDQPNGGFNEGENQIRKKQELLPYDVRVIDHVLRYERPTGSKNRSLRCVTHSFHFFLDLLRQKAQSGQVSKQGGVKSRLARIYQKKKYPIIVVPEGIQAGNVSLSNIQTLLLHGRYQQPKPLTNTLQRKLQMQTTLHNKKIIFQITNNPSLLSLSDWQNVCAVFIVGQKSQFSTWSIRDPLQIFKKTKGFFLKYSNISTKHESNDWNVKTFVIERNARYRDQEIQKKIWEEIEGFLFQKV